MAGAPPPKRQALAGPSDLPVDGRRSPGVRDGSGSPPPRVTLENAVSRLSPSLTARFGCEIEVPRVFVEPAPPRGTVLLERPGWKLEVDDAGEGKADLEFVTEPLGSEREVRAVVAEMTTVAESMRQRALQGDVSFPLREVAPDAMQDCNVRVEDARFAARLQATYGVGLSDVSMAMDELLGPKQAADIHGSTAAAAARYREATGDELSANARAFVDLVNMYLARAQPRFTGNGTVHTYFRMMARSDFCSMYEKLLDDADRQALKKLLLPQDGHALPMLMQALGMSDADRRVFSKPYLLADKDPANKADGPTVRDWLKSIVEGRADGSFKKDLMSPPPGYALHTGELAVDYGMGAMGVDERQQLALFEIRGAPYRPNLVPMNGQLGRAVRNELSHASQHNPELGSERPAAAQSKKYDLLQQSEFLYRQLLTMQQRLADVSSQFHPNDWRYLERSLASQLGSLNANREKVEERGNSPWAPGLAQSMGDVGAVMSGILEAGRSCNDFGAIATWLPRLDDAMAAYERQLWEAGRKRAEPGSD